MLMDDPAYPFLASSGIPSVSFRFISKNVSVEAKQPCRKLLYKTKVKNKTAESPLVLASFMNWVLQMRLHWPNSQSSHQ